MKKENSIQVFPTGNVPFLIPASELGRQLRVKFGMDPTTSELHLGHLVPLRQLRRAQENGHIAVLIMGDTTAMIGDPTGRSATRPQLSQETVNHNAEVFLDAARKILLQENLEVHFNSDWLGKLDFGNMLKLLSDFTVSQMLTRNDFRQRLDAGNPVGLHELLYGVCQALDSVEVSADVELGGVDQLLNLMLGRDLQERRGLSPQICVTVPLLIGTDGKEKMSKSLNNHIPLALPANDMFGRIMSFSDDPLPLLLEFLSDFPCQEKKTRREQLENGRNPMEIKLELAENITAQFHGRTAASNARSSFVCIHKTKQLPDISTLPAIQLPNDKIIHIPQLLKNNNVVESTGAGRRLIEGNGVKLNGNKITAFDLPVNQLKETILQVGKNKFFRLE